jgi:uncharacterized protein involved in propanediol utilization
MSKVNLTISVDDNHMDRMAEVVQKLQAVGLNVKQSMEQLGIVIGSCDSEQVEALSEVEGVSNVEAARQYQLAPPDSDIQ